MEEPIVTINEGKLLGKVCNDREGAQFFSFQGIPYAKPPVGHLRFKAPQPVDRWNGIKDVTKEGNPNIQMDFMAKKVIGSEDCLNLNVYTPKISEEKREVLPVMVYIHGGAFTYGSNRTDMFGPEFLVAENIVLVVINYRLGLLGLLSLEDPSLGVSGNASFKDMVLALKWVQNNISFFNGDPNNVTIFGESAGGAAVHLLMLSPMAKGLFHKVILQSGCALNGWVYGRKCAKELCSEIGLNTDDEKEMLRFLRKASAEQIFDGQVKLEKEQLMGNKPRACGLTIENASDETPFLTRHPLEIMISGDYNKVPIIMGYTSLEGIVFDMLVKKQEQPRYWKNFENNIPYSLNLKKGSPLLKQVTEMVMDFYFGQTENISKETHTKEIYDYTTDNNILKGVYDSAKIHAENNHYPVYLYRMNLETELNFIKHLLRVTIPGTCHGDDIGYLFKTSFTPKISSGSIEDVSQRRLCKLWTNFAKYGNPTPTENPLIGVNWTPVDHAGIHYLDIDKELVMKKNPEEERMKFWDYIYSLTDVQSKL